MCTVLLPPGVYPIAVKYIISHEAELPKTDVNLLRHRFSLLPNTFHLPNILALAMNTDLKIRIFRYIKNNHLVFLSIY